MQRASQMKYPSISLLVVRLSRKEILDFPYLPHDKFGFFNTVIRLYRGSIVKYS
jgi:hypothetical protein